MFSLIISIISIALVAALAAATVYFGGAAFNKGSAGADASTFINGAQQVAGAFTLASADNNLAPTSTVADLQSGLGTPVQIYLSQVPTYKGTKLALDGTAKDYIKLPVSDQVCAEINNRAAPGVALDVDMEGLYGCIVDATDAPKVWTAFYKVK